MKIQPLLALSILACSTATAVAGTMPPVDRTLRSRLVAAGISPLDPAGPTPPRAKVGLGQMLFFDKVLGGNRDIACATCHHPAFMPGGRKGVRSRCFSNTAPSRGTGRPDDFPQGFNLGRCRNADLGMPVPVALARRAPGTPQGMRHRHLRRLEITEATDETASPSAHAGS